MGWLRDLFGLKKKKTVEYFKKNDREIEVVVKNSDGSVLRSLTILCFPPGTKSF